MRHLWKIALIISQINRACSNQSTLFFYLHFDTESSSERDYFAFGTQRCLIIINQGWSFFKQIKKLNQNTGNKFILIFYSIKKFPKSKLIIQR